MKKRGFTIIELISSFALTSLIVALLFEVIFILKDLYTDSGVKTELLTKQALMSEKINKDLNTKTVTVASKCGDSCILFNFSDGTSSELSFSRENNTFKYGNYKTKLIDGSQYGNIDISTETVLNMDIGKNDSILKINIPIYHKLLKQQEFGINIAYQYDSRNTSIIGLLVTDILDVEKQIYLMGNKNAVTFAGIPYQDPGYYVVSADGTVTQDDESVIVEGTVGDEVGKTYTITYTILDSNDNIMQEVSRYVTVVSPTTVFNYTGDVQEYTVPVNGLYKIEVWGAQGGTVGEYSVGGKGGYTTGQINLTKNSILNVYAGGQGSYSKTESVAGGFNGGGASGYGSNTSGGSGGGASDVRQNGTDLSNRIIVAGGGGGAGSKNDSTDLGTGGAGGGTVGLIGAYSTASYNGQPGTATAGGAQATYTTDVTTLPTAGTLGLGGNGGSHSNTYGGGGGGAGYYGGGGGVRYGTGAGGSGYCGSMLNCTTYNGTQTFNDVTGNVNEIGHQGHGAVKITLISISDGDSLTLNDNLSSTYSCVKTLNEKCLEEDIKSDEGIKVNVQVNESENYDFYVVSDTGSELTLIMDRNLGNKIEWISKTDYNDDTNYGTFGNNNKGPITALQELKSLTSTWKNIDPYSYILTNDSDNLGGSYGYTEVLEENVKARLLTYTEANSLGCTSSSGSCPIWLSANLSSMNTAEEPYGYWLSTAYSSSSSWAWLINSSKKLEYNFYLYSNNGNGIRPVIKIKK